MPLRLTAFLCAGLLLVFPEDCLCLELNVSSSHVLLNPNTSFTVVSKHLMACLCVRLPVGSGQ